MNSLLLKESLVLSFNLLRNTFVIVEINDTRVLRRGVVINRVDVTIVLIYSEGLSSIHIKKILVSLGLLRLLMLLRLLGRLRGLRYLNKV